ncbi:MAG: hypothetical protein LOY03_12830 [Cyclobacteriaceae bacterium]|jgi:hypothetical protein|nr:hypothetical protein [Cyclobacteriaceae bacterium]
MKFDIDVLIIFAEQDNEPSGEGNPGWVSQFRRFLELMLTQVLGEKPNVLLKGEHDSLTSPRLDNAATLVTILSKDFCKSGPCLDYTEAFVKATEDTPQTIGRIFKVFKNYIPVMDQPPRLRSLIGYDMYQLDPDSGQTTEYTDYFSTEAERQYWMKMVDLAYDIYDTLMRLRGEGPTEVRTLYERKAIYLAETGHDLSVQRNIIKRELQRHGYLVLPGSTLPSRRDELEQAVERDLEASSHSIHLIGAAYGEIPEGSDISVIEIQNNLAAKKSQRAKEANESFSRLIWIYPHITNASQKQQTFIERIKRDAEVQEGAEILQTPLEDFKNIMREELLEGDDRTISHSSGSPSVYLVYDRADGEAVGPVKKALEENGFQVLTPAFEGEVLELRRKHIDNLRSFDIAVIYKGQVNEQWVRMKLLDLLKAPGFGRKKPILGKVLIGTPAAGSLLNGQDVTVLDGEIPKVINQLQDLLHEFTAAKT